MCCMPPSKASSTFVSYVDQGPAKTLPFRSNSSRSTASRQAITPEESNGIVFPAQSYDLVFQRLANVATRRFFSGPSSRASWVRAHLATLLTPLPFSTPGLTVEDIGPLERQHFNSDRRCSGLRSASCPPFPSSAPNRLPMKKIFSAVLASPSALFDGPQCRMHNMSD